MTGRSSVRERSRLVVVVAATALALVWFLPNISFVVAQDSGSVVETTTTTSTSTTSTSTTSTTLAPTTTTTSPISPVISAVQSILLQLGTTTAAPGDPVGGSGQGAPDSSIDLTLFSRPVFLGTVTTDANGNFLFTFNVPLDIDPGPHTVEAVGRSGERGTASLNVVPAANAGQPTGYPLPVLPYGTPGATPLPVGQAVPTSPSSSSGPAYTGVNAWGLTLLAAAALALGAMALTFGRLQPVIELPGRNRRRPHWAHRSIRFGRLRQMDRADLVQIAVCVALGIALGLSLARQ